MTAIFVSTGQMQTREKLTVPEYADSNNHAEPAQSLTSCCMHLNRIISRIFSDYDGRDRSSILMQSSLHRFVLTLTIQADVFRQISEAADILLLYFSNGCRI